MESFSNDARVDIGPLEMRMDHIKAFQYCVDTCLRGVTDVAVHGARLVDVRRQMINSERLNTLFDENADNLDALQHNMDKRDCRTTREECGKA